MISNISLSPDIQNSFYEEYSSIIDKIIRTNVDSIEKRQLYFLLLNIFDNFVQDLLYQNKIDNFYNKSPVFQSDLRFYSQLNPNYSACSAINSNYCYLPTNNYYPMYFMYPRISEFSPNYINSLSSNNLYYQSTNNQYQVQFNFECNSNSKKTASKNKKSHKKYHKKEKPSKNRQKSKKSKSDVKIFKYTEGSELRGILRYLTDETKGNIHDNGTIEITSNSILSDEHPHNLVDYDKDSFYQCNDEPNAYVCFDFKNMSIQLTNYTIKNGDSLRHFYLRNWVIEISSDGQSWIEIDHHDNDSTMNGAFISHTFSCSKKEGFYRFVKLRLYGKNWSSESHKYTVWFPFIEFFGKLKIPKS